MKQIFLVLNLELITCFNPRNKETLQHIQIKNLYPCGEGAGYAGGIISAAIDGERCALMIDTISK